MIQEKLLRKKIQSQEVGPAYLLISADSEILKSQVDYFVDINQVKPEEKIELFPADKKNGEIIIGQIRQLKDQLSRLSTTGSRMVVIYSVEKINTEAANSFLKLLEEPPANTTIILLSATAQILPTIASRCQKYYFPSFKIEFKEFDADFIKTLQVKSLKELFSLAEKTAKEQKAGVLIEDMLVYYSEQFKKDQKYLKMVEQLQQGLKRYQKNINARLILENILVELRG
jgi:hypothetical protein